MGESRGIHTHTFEGNWKQLNGTQNVSSVIETKYKFIKVFKYTLQLIKNVPTRAKIPIVHSRSHKQILKMQIIRPWTSRQVKYSKILTMNYQI